MTTLARSMLLLASLSLVPTASVLAQNNNPGNSGGTKGSEIAIPTYPPGQNSDPALTTGRLPSGATNVPADENPNVRGATGDTIVKGDRSTIVGDRRATIQQKTGTGEEGGGGN